MQLSPRTWHLLTLLADGDFYSGEVLAQCLGVSRATVCNALDQAVQMGIGLQRVRGRGYRLNQPWQMLNPTVLADGLGPLNRRLRLDILQQAGSSNAVLLQRLQHGAPSGSVVAVELQTAGRGRQGRVWHSELGNALTFSLLWRFDSGFAQLAGLSLAVGLAMVRALRQLGLHEARLKWPNDVLIPSGKLGGILLEARGDMQGPCAVVIGIGLNQRLPLHVQQRIDQAAGALSDLHLPLPERNQLLVALLQQLVPLLDAFAVTGFAPLVAEWQMVHAHQDRPVRLRLPDGSQLEGIARGVDVQGNLKLETASGLRLCHSGEIG